MYNNKRIQKRLLFVHLKCGQGDILAYWPKETNKIRRRLSKNDIWGAHTKAMQQVSGADWRAFCTAWLRPCTLLLCERERLCVSQAHTQVNTHSLTHSLSHEHTHTRISTHTNTHTHTHTHAHTHTHKRTRFVAIAAERAFSYTHVHAVIPRVKMTTQSSSSENVSKGYKVS